MLNRFSLLARMGLLLAVTLFRATADDQVIVRATAGTIGDIASRHGLSVVRSLQGSATGLHVLKPPQGQTTAQAVQGLQTDTAVADAEDDQAVSLPETSMAPLLAPPAITWTIDRSVVNYYGNSVMGSYVSQPAALKIRLADAHKYTSGAGTVAFLDTGVDFSHPALANTLLPGYDFTRNIPGGSELADLNQSTTSILDQSTTSILDKTAMLVLSQSTTSILDQSTTSILDGTPLPAEFGHGTMVAGLIHLAAPTALLLPVKVFSDDGTTTLSQIVAGIYWAVDQGADVINMSFSSRQSSPELALAIAYASAHHVICVASVGNDGIQTMVYPAGYSTVMGIASTNNNDQRSWFSNYGEHLVTLGAPGEGLLTLFPGKGYALAWGTSFSTPLVAGGAALVVGIKPTADQSTAQSALMHAASASDVLGAGRLDLFSATNFLVSGGQ